MVVLSFVLGLLCGLCAVFVGSSFKGWGVKLRNPLGVDEKYLLTAARAAGGRLIVREEPENGLILLRLREVPGHPRMEKKEQMEHLLNRDLLKPDPTGLPGRFLLTATGWAFVKHLPALPVEVKRAGNWYNSISRKPRPLTRK